MILYFLLNVRNLSTGFGLVEILVGLFCLSLALLPILSLYSTTIETAQIIQARSQSCLLAQELTGLIISTPPQNLQNGTFNLTNNELPDFGKDWKLTPVPKNFNRVLTINSIDTGILRGKSIQITVYHNEISQASMTWYRSIFISEDRVN